MDLFQKPIDLPLWMDAELIQRQNHLKRQFTGVFEAVGNGFSQADFLEISHESKGAKISKGNDLLEFPYQVLDLIRNFDPGSGANIRILNWFGNGLYLTVFLGKNRKNPIPEFLNLGFYYGMSESQWDYPDLILNGNFSTDEVEIEKSNRGFHHWIKELQVSPSPTEVINDLQSEVKKILGLLIDK